MSTLKESSSSGHSAPPKPGPRSTTSPPLLWAVPDSSELSSLSLFFNFYNWRVMSLLSLILSSFYFSNFLEASCPLAIKSFFEVYYWNSF